MLYESSTDESEEASLVCETTMISKHREEREIRTADQTAEAQNNLRAILSARMAFTRRSNCSAGDGGQNKRRCGPKTSWNPLQHLLNHCIEGFVI